MGFLIKLRASVFRNGVTVLNLWWRLGGTGDVTVGGLLTAAPRAHHVTRSVIVLRPEVISVIDRAPLYAPPPQGHLSEGYGKLCSVYLKLLITKMEFHIKVSLLTSNPHQSPHLKDPVLILIRCQNIDGSCCHRKVSLS